MESIHISSTTITGGSDRFGGNFSNNADTGLAALNGRLRISSDIQGNSDIITLIASSINTNSEGVFCSINYTEFG